LWGGGGGGVCDWSRRGLKAPRWGEAGWQSTFKKVRGTLKEKSPNGDARTKGETKNCLSREWEMRQWEADETQRTFREGRGPRHTASLISRREYGRSPDRDDKDESREMRIRSIRGDGAMEPRYTCPVGRSHSVDAGRCSGLRGEPNQSRKGGEVGRRIK